MSTEAIKNLVGHPLIVSWESASTVLKERTEEVKVQPKDKILALVGKYTESVKAQVQARACKPRMIMQENVKWSRLDAFHNVDAKI